MRTRIIQPVYRFLRSRRLAIWLIVGITAYSLLVTAVPLGSDADPKVKAWAAANPLAERFAQLLGLHHAYTTPWFLGAAALLTASTIACSLERTGQALRAWRQRGKVDSRLINRLEKSPTFVWVAPAEISDDDALMHAEKQLRGLRLSVKRGPSLVEARSNDIGALGSPLFHWGLVALFVLAGLGQLTRSEGVLPLRIGGTVQETHEAYTAIKEAPLFNERHSGLRLTAVAINPDILVDGVKRGAAPRLELSGPDGKLVKRQWVYPNNPLSYRGMTVHSKDTGPALLVSVRSRDATQTRVFYLKRSEEATYGIVPLTVEFADGNKVYPVTIAPRPGRRVAFIISGPPKGIPAEQIAQAGGTAKLPGGSVLEIVELGAYAELNVVHDWSVLPIYAAFALGLAGLALSIFMPPRVVWVKRASADTGGLKVLVSNRRIDPAFGLRVRRALMTVDDDARTEQLNEGVA